MNRHLDWEGSWNARDLGGLRTVGGRALRVGAVVRSESLDCLTARGWAALEAHGVRTLLDLRDLDQAEKEPQHPPASVSTVPLPIERGLLEDPEFARWAADGWLGTPLYYQGFIARWPDRCARVIAAIATARPGGVVVHCGMGRDRTGLIVMLLLQLLGVSPDDIEADHGLTAERLPLATMRETAPHDENAAVQQVLDRANRSRREVILQTLRAIDVERALRSGGLSDDQLAALRQRVLDA